MARLVLTAGDSQQPVQLGGRREPTVFRKEARATVRQIERLCARGMSPETLTDAVVIHLRRLLGFDALCWNRTDPGTMLVTHSRSEQMPGASPATAQQFFENEYAWDDVAKFSTLARAPQPVGILSESTGGELQRSRRYRLITSQVGLEHEARVAFVAGGACWATASLHRRAGAPDFTSEDTSLLALVGGTVARGLRTGALLAASTASSTVEVGAAVPAAAVHDQEGGVLVLDEQYDVVAVTSEAERWLAELPSDSVNAVPAGWPLPAVVYAVAVRVRCDAAGGTGSALPPTARIRTHAGRWVRLHGADLTERAASGEAQGRGRRIAVVIEPARPPDILPFLEQAYELTGRECEVVRLVLSGASSADIAARLVISPYTVQDHLKAIFEKVGVRNRRDLVQHFLGEHYFPRLLSGVPANANGWFAR